MKIDVVESELKHATKQLGYINQADLESFCMVDEVDQITTSIGV